MIRAFIVLCYISLLLAIATPFAVRDYNYFKNYYKELIKND